MCVATKDGLPTSMQDEIEDKDKDYHSFPHKEWCDLLSTMEAKDNRKRTTDQIKILAASKAVPANYFSNVSAKVTLKNKASTCAIHTRKQQGKKNPNHKGSQRYCVLCKKTGMPERKYKLYSSENCFGCRSDHESIKEGLVGILINRNKAVKQYQKSENKWKREMKPLKKQNKMLFSKTRCSGSRREPKKINKIRAKESKKHKSSSSSSSSSDYDSSLSSDIE